MSTIAVFIALGGTSYAVARNSIGNTHLKRDAVTSVKVKDRSLKRSDLAPSARLGSRGPRGPQGIPGSVTAGGLSPDAWTVLPFIGGWGNYGGFVGGGFRKDKQGQVHLRGVITQGNGAPPSSAIIAVLPPGYRPATREVLSTYGGNPDGASRIDILPDGALTWVVGPTSETDYTTLSGLSYWPD